MQFKIAGNKKEEKLFLAFRKKKYLSDAKYVDNNYFMLQEIFDQKLHFVNSMEIIPAMILLEENDACLQSGKPEGDLKAGDILCEAVIAYTKELPEYIQICFFESLKDCPEAVELLVLKAGELGKKHACSKIVIGLYGHVNYGLGLLNSDYECMNSFSSPGNPRYYNEYFLNLGCETIRLNSYYTYSPQHHLDRYAALIRKLNRKYKFRPFDKRKFEEDSKIYTDLNNACFTQHKYYYHRDYEDDYEMLKELFLFMKEDSLFYAFDGEKPVGFILWYPDYNELAKPGEAFGTKHFFVNKIKGKNIQTAKVMEWGVLEEYRGVGLPIALTDQVLHTLSNYKCSRIETSWILADNDDSNSICQAICDKKYKEYAVYELPIQ